MRQPNIPRNFPEKPIHTHKTPSNEPLPIIVSRTITYIDEHPASDLSIKALGKVFRYNGQYISHRFRESMGITLQQYIIYKRLDLSKKYLAEGYSLTNACRLSGFHNYSNFSKTFIKYVGASPKIYQLELYSHTLYERPQ